jgi:hypothetical protein
MERLRDDLRVTDRRPGEMLECDIVTAMKISYLIQTVLVIPMVLAVAHGGTVNGNGCCYGTDPPDGKANVGKYCGKGGGGASGASCQCGAFIAVQLPGVQLNLRSIMLEQAQGAEIKGIFKGIDNTYAVEYLLNGESRVFIVDATGKVEHVPPAPTCPNLNFAFQSRANSSVVNASLALTDKGPGSASNVKVTSIACTSGFVYTPQNGLLKIPFVVPGAATMMKNATTGFNVFLTRPGGPLNAPFSCTINWTEGSSCKGIQVLNIP